MAKIEALIEWRQTAGLPLVRVLWLGPAAYILHWVEEHAGFPRWVAAHFSVAFSPAQHQRNGVIFMVLLLGLSILVARARGKSSALLLVTYVSGLLFHNGLFHLGATLVFGAYSPGLATGALLSLPVSLLLMTTAVREELITRVQVFAALVLGGVIHYAVILGQLTNLLQLES